MKYGDPDVALLQTAIFSFLAAAGWALAAILAIWLGATRLPPRIPRGQVWAQWRKRRTLWMLSLMLGGLGAWFTAEQFIQRIGIRELFWMAKPLVVLSAGRLGAATGYFLVLALATLIPAVRQARNRKKKGPPPPVRKH